MTLYVAFFGATLFLMLWEARGRYLFGFVPAVLLLLAARGALRTEEGMERCKALVAQHKARRSARRCCLIGMGLMIPVLSVHGGQHGAFPVAAV